LVAKNHFTKASQESVLEKALAEATATSMDYHEDMVNETGEVSQPMWTSRHGVPIEGGGNCCCCFWLDKAHTKAGKCQSLKRLYVKWGTKPVEPSIWNGWAKGQTEPSENPVCVADELLQKDVANCYPRKYKGATLDPNSARRYNNPTDYRKMNMKTNSEGRIVESFSVGC